MFFIKLRYSRYILKPRQVNLSDRTSCQNECEVHDKLFIKMNVTFNTNILSACI